jgi:hypothetical protein
MSTDHRYYVVSPSGAAVVGFDRAEVAARVAVEYGEGAHIVDTRATPYHPMAEIVRDGAPVYLEHGAWDTRTNPDLNLIEAVKKGCPAITRAFFAKAADIDAADKNGGTALIWAVAKGEPETLRLLIAAGADLDARDSKATSALVLARRKNRADLVEILEAAGAKD